MGMFDTVYFYCHECGERIELQSKSGDCFLNVYSLTYAPPDVLGGLAGEKGNCNNCGASYEVFVTVSARVEMTRKD